MSTISVKCMYGQNWSADMANALANMLSSSNTRTEESFWQQTGHCLHTDVETDSKNMTLNMVHSLRVPPEQYA